MPKSLIVLIEELAADIQKLYMGPNAATYKLARAQLKDPYPTELRERADNIMNAIRFAFYNSRARTHRDTSELSNALGDLEQADTHEFKTFVEQVKECAEYAARVIGTAAIDHSLEDSELFKKLELSALQKISQMPFGSPETVTLGKTLSQALEVYRVMLTEQHLYPKEKGEQTLQIQEQKILANLDAIYNLSSNSDFQALVTEAKQQLLQAPVVRSQLKAKLGI